MDGWKCESGGALRVARCIAVDDHQKHICCDKHSLLRHGEGMLAWTMMMITLP